MSRIYAIIPAAGEGVRFGGKKQDILLGGKTLLQRVEEVFHQIGCIEKIIVVGKDIPGGKSRAESVFLGFCQINGSAEDVVIIHDAARPLVSRRLIETIIEDTRKKGAVVPVIPVSDTIKKTREGQIVETIDRKNIVGVQTPQGFLYGKLKNAYTKVVLSEEITDEARLLELAGEKVFTAEGEKTNIKITTPDDLRMAEALCA